MAPQYVGLPMWRAASGAHDGVMFSHPITTDAVRRQHRDRLMGAAATHRRLFGRRVADDVAPVSLASVVAMPTRVDRTSPRDSRVA